MLNFFGDIGRFVRILATLRRTGGLELALESMTSLSARARKLIGVATAPLIPFGARGDEGLPPLARALSALGPSHVKFGQVLSTRPDIAGDALALDLRTLQDRLPAFPDEEARRVVEDQLDGPIEAYFKEFGPPIAAASIAQVHPATTLDGRHVAVKVLRPNVEEAFKKDISAFYLAARSIEILRPKSRRLRPTAVVKHFEGVVTREMDLRLEAAAGSEYHENIQGMQGFRTPQIVWPLTAKRVLTTDWVVGTRMAEREELVARGLDLPEMAKRLVRVFLRSALQDGFFHADMHQGNLKVAPNGDVVAFDFGIMGRIDAKTRRTYAEILYSYLTRDYRRGAQAHFDAGYVSRDQNIEHFAQALRSIGEPIVGQEASKISMARVLQQLFDVTERFGMETRQELILLQRTMVVVEGVARSLDPNFNMWEAARPAVEEWMTDNLGPKAVLKDTDQAVRSLLRLRPFLPELTERFVEFAEAASERKEPPAPVPDRFWPGVAVGLALAATLLAAGILGAQFAV